MSCTNIFIKKSITLDKTAAMQVRAGEVIPCCKSEVGKSFETILNNIICVFKKKKTLKLACKIESTVNHLKRCS